MIIALDLGGVCADVNSDIMRHELQERLKGRFSLAELAAKEEELRTFWDALERGKLGAEEFFAEMHRLSGGSFPPRNFGPCGAIRSGAPSPAPSKRRRKR